MDLLAPLPDPALLLGTGLDLGRGGMANAALDWGTQSLITDSVEQKSASGLLALPNDDLDLALGDDDFTTGISGIEVGRDRVSGVWHDEYAGDNSKLNDDDLGLDLDDGPLLDIHSPEPTAGADADITMTDLPGLDLDDEAGAERFGQEARAGDSALPHNWGSEEREPETTVQEGQDVSLYEPPQEESMHEAQRIKRRKILEQDEATELSTAQIKSQLNDREKIMKPYSSLPRDPVLLALMTMQKSGGFVSSILGNGRTSGWAPELRDILSVEVIRRSGDLKRKRDSGVSDMYLSDGKEAPGLEIPDDEPSAFAGHGLGDASAYDEGMFEQLPSDGVRAPSLINDRGEHGTPEQEAMSPAGDFDDTTMPLLHPADAGPISQGTRHAVHLLRDHFGTDTADNASQRQKKSVLFQDLLPQATTSRSNATKMFFEVLVLATKDAVKVEQKPDSLSGPIRLRAKRGLWGSWAEESAGGQISQDQQMAGAEE